MDTLNDAADPGSGTGPEEEAGEQPEEEKRPPAHYQTGKLTAAQAAAVAAWRARLRTDKPLPGTEPASAAARLVLGTSDHPRASTSDVIAAAVYDMMRRRSTRPRPLALAAYAYRTMRAARPGWVFSDVDPPERPPVSWYAPPDLAEEVEALREAACKEAWDKAKELKAKAAERYPGEGEEVEAHRTRWINDQVYRYGLWYAGRAVPPGAIARMAIDRWAPLSVDEVIGAGVAWCQEHHDQWHRARKDMRAPGSG